MPNLGDRQSWDAFVEGSDYRGWRRACMRIGPGDVVNSSASRSRSVLIDVSHPAHVHFFRPLAQIMSARGDDVRFAGRRKDVTLELLENAGTPYVVASKAAHDCSRITDVAELLQRVIRLRRLIRDMKPDVILTRNPSGVLAGMCTRTWTVFDTDDGRTVGLHYWLGAPFADVVTSSIHDPERHGTRHLRYRALKPHAFLHPDRLRLVPPDVADLDLGATPVFAVRWSRHDASHDGRIRGVSPTTRRAVVELLQQRGHVVLSSEGEPLRLLRHADREIQLPSDRFHPLLARASLCINDGQAVSAEAALLGVPTVRLSGFSGRVWYLAHLERLGLVMNFQPGQEADLLAAISTALADEGLQARARAAADRLNRESEDLTAWFIRLIDGLPYQRRWRRLRADPPGSSVRGVAH